MASPFDRLMRYVQPYVPGSIDAAIREELYAVCETFFSQTNVWKEDLGFELGPNDDSAEVMPYTGKIIRLLWVNNSDGFPVMRVIMPDTETGLVQFPSTAGAGSYVATVALTVSDPVARDAFPIVPQPLVSKFWQVLAHGVLSQMCAQPNKPYTDANRAAYFLAKFRGGMARARNTENTGNTRSSQAWNYPQSFNRRK